MRFFTGFILPALFSSLSFFAQPPGEEPPRLVVGIVIDQMRNDYIYRYWQRFGDDGFKRLVKNGFYFRNAHFNYMPTYTGPGHCSVYTGTTPRHHGIIANHWYVKEKGSMQYCVYDGNVKPVGTDSDAGRMSPIHQLSPTIGDELKISSAQRSKVFAVALKDRGAVLPAGHAADGAFWFETTDGKFVSSAWYMNELPHWLQAYNEKAMPREYLTRQWQTLYPVGTYTSSLPDENNYEEKRINGSKAVFPYDLSTAKGKDRYSVLPYTPYGNFLVKDVALACLKGEGLGKDGDPDLLSISFSATDYAGHAFGPRSVEVEDIYLRLDRDIAEILKALDEQVGKGKYTVFLTADHGAPDVPNHLKDHGIPAGYVYEKVIATKLKAFLQSAFSDSLLLAGVSNEQVFLDEKRLTEAGIDEEMIAGRICGFLLKTEGIAEAYPATVLKHGSFSEPDVRALLQNGYNHRMSGHVALVYLSNYIDHGQEGTSHGSGYAYDTHVPLIFFGSGIKKGETHSYVPVTAIAPTITELLKIQRPAASISQPLNIHFR